MLCRVTVRLLGSGCWVVGALANRDRWLQPCTACIPNTSMQEMLTPYKMCTINLQAYTHRMKQHTPINTEGKQQIQQFPPCTLAQDHTRAGVGPIFSPGVSGPYRPPFFSDGRLCINEQHKTCTIHFWINAIV